MITTFRTTVRGRTIELPWDLGLPANRIIEVTIKTCPEVESPPEPPLPGWLQRMEIEPTGAPGRFILKGTQLRAEALLEEGKSDDELLRTYPQLNPKDVAALREYAKLPLSFRQARALSPEEAKDLDEFLAWNREQRKMVGRELEP